MLSFSGQPRVDCAVLGLYLPLNAALLTSLALSLTSPMSDRPPTLHVEILANTRDVQIGEQKNYIVNGNQYISSNDQTST